VKGVVDGETYFVGNQRLLDTHRIPVDVTLMQRFEAWSSEAKTMIWFASSQQALAVIAIADQIKPGSLEAIRQLKQEGIRVYMLTGDQEATARSVAARAGIADYKAGVLPEHKAAFIKQLQQEGHTVAMVGDGI
ncbi:MAG TPA: heavy metal translocating P-type ATPase, partial [Saprospirales bacterium]|nr:heavy metal translocating P-type ATPase [Saprospirales bacterium]